MSLGLTVALGWTMTAAVLAAVAVLFAVIATKSLKGITLKKANEESDKKEKAVLPFP